MKFEVVYTDTFGGDPNFAWVQRAVIDAPDTASARMLLSRARRTLGLDAVRGRLEDGGDTLAFWPVAECTVLFITPAQS